MKTYPVRELDELRHRCDVAIRAWDEERKRALREAARVTQANKLLDEAFGFVNPPLADAISEYLAQFDPENESRCCNNEKRNARGSCENCGDPCL